MSRALQEILQNGDHSAVFEHLAHALTQHDDDDGRRELLEVEILSQSHAVAPGKYCLRDENALGVPKMRLLEAFVVARRILSTHCAENPMCDGITGSATILGATAVILLTDPEHLTAANTRKRILLQRLKTGLDAQKYLDREKWFVDSLLTSRLHRHTKSPTLWSHRRWLMERRREFGAPDSILKDLEIIKTAGERHPRNYTAWAHARWLSRWFEADLRAEAEVLKTLLAEVEKWCKAHNDDISGWSFLDHLLSSDIVPDRSAAQGALERTLEFAEDFRWRNESVWWFLRTMAGRMSFGLEGGQEKFTAVNRRLVQGADVRSVSTLQRALDWYGEHRLASPTT